MSTFLKKDGTNKHKYKTFNIESFLAKKNHKKTINNYRHNYIHLRKKNKTYITVIKCKNNIVAGNRSINESN